MYTELYASYPDKFIKIDEIDAEIEHYQLEIDDIKTKYKIR